MSNLALLLRTDGSFEVLDWPKNGTLPLLYSTLECHTIDAVGISNEFTMWIDDEGAINGSARNLGATLIYAAHQPPHQWYHGHAVITGGSDRYGNTRGLTADQIATLVQMHLPHANIPTQRNK
ncbi:DUF3846 domain-containing protein [Streptomyces sp. NPDC086010]|uniref:DUF3846 domain-containing protein n=1 Tax=Streptomyces sp. NPDC086010 TaxID=3365745 RepID=UPI0037D0A934